MKLRYIILLLIGIVLLYFAFSALRRKGSADDDKNERPTYTVVRGEVSSSVIESGSIEAVQSVEVKSRVSGRLQHLFVEEGDNVQKGQEIATIDPEELNLQLQQSTAQLRGAESSAARSRANIDITEKQLRSSLTEAEGRYNLALRDWQNQPELTRTSLEQSRLAYESAQRARDLLAQVTHPQELVLVDATHSQAQAQFDRDRANVDRLTGLLEKGYVSQRDVDAARAQFAASEAALRNAKESKTRLESKQSVERKNAEQRVAETKAAFDQALARANIDKGKLDALNQAKAALDLARSDLRRVQLEKFSYEQAAAQAAQIRATVADSNRLLRETKIKAPMSGTVTKKFVEVGELVSALNSFSGGTSIVQIADLKRLQVKLLINEIDVAKLKPQSHASVEVDAIPNVKFDGVVERIAPSSQTAAASPGAQPSTDAVVKYEVIVTLANADPRIRPGMSAKCTIFVEKVANVLKVPVEFVTKDDKGYWVNVIQQGSKTPERRQIKVGVITTTDYQVTDGLKEGDVLSKPEYTGPPRQGMMSG